MRKTLENDEIEDHLKAFDSDSGRVRVGGSLDCIHTLDVRMQKVEQNPHAHAETMITTISVASIQEDVENAETMQATAFAPQFVRVISEEQ